MCASLVALGAVVWSDIAQASQQPVPIELTDELTAAPPVKLQKFKYEVVEEEELEDDGYGELGRINFGKFEGY